MIKKPVYNVGEFVFYYNKWGNEVEHGEIVGIRESKLNWDFKLRYQVYNNMHYIHWIEQKYLARDEQSLYKFLQ